MTSKDQSFLLRCPDVIRDLYIETLPLVSLQVHRCAGAASHTGADATPQLPKYEVKL